MGKSHLRVNVEAGMFDTERTVSFQAGERNYTLIVDEEDVQDNTLEVFVVAQDNGEAIVDLPRDTFTSGSRIRVPLGDLLSM